MKVIKASSVVAGNDGYICYLTRKEALAVCELRVVLGMEKPVLQLTVCFMPSMRVE